MSVENFDMAFQVKREILSRLEQFFSPGGPEEKTGWKIGQFPEVMQIKNAVNSIHGIVCIQNIMMSAYTVNTEKKAEVDIDAAKSDRYVLPVNGEHEIMIFA